MPKRPLLAVLLVSLALPALPALLVHMPPLLDYPDHFARLWLIAGGAELEPVSRMYAVDWSKTWTNIGIDLAAAALGPFLKAETFGPVLVAAGLVLPPAGAVALNRAALGAWHPWQVGFAFLAFAGTLLAGFINFQIGLGLALLAAATDPWAAHRLPSWGRFLWRVAMATAILPVHVFAVAFYAALIGALALGPHFSALVPGRPEARGWLVRALAAGLAAAVPVLLYYLFSPVVPATDAGGTLSGAEWNTDPRWKLGVLLMPVWAYHLPVDVALAAALALPLALALVVGRLHVHAGLLLGAAGLAALALVSPVNAAGALAIDARFAIMAALTFVAALRPEYARAPEGVARAPGGGRRIGTAVAAGLLALVAVRTAWVGGIWEARSRTDTAAVERALERVPAGAAVLSMAHVPSRGGRKAAPLGRYGMLGSTYESLPALAVPQRRAYAVLFARRGMHTLRVLPPWDELHGHDANLLSVHALARPAEALPGRSSFVRLWRDRFDYVLVLNADLPDEAGPMPSLPGLEPVADEGFARLYKVHRRAAPAEGGGPVTAGVR